MKLKDLNPGDLFVVVNDTRRYICEVSCSLQNPCEPITEGGGALALGPRNILDDSTDFCIDFKGFSNTGYFSSKKRKELWTMIDPLYRLQYSWRWVPKNVEVIKVDSWDEYQPAVVNVKKVD